MSPRLLRRAFLLSAAVSLSLLTAAEPVDLKAVQLIRSEAFERSKVLDHMYNLTDVRGPRLTGSPNYMAAAEWAAGRLKEYGLKNVHLEKWGPFGRGWTYSKYNAAMTAPVYMPLVGFPMAWTEGTKGPIKAEVIIANIRTDGDMEKWKGKLKDKIILLSDPRDTPINMKSLADRYSDKDLDELMVAQLPNAKLPGMPGGAARDARMARMMADVPPAQREKLQAMLEDSPLQAFEIIRKLRSERRNKLIKFMREEGVLAGIEISYNGDGQTVFASSYGSYDVKDEKPMSVIAVSTPNYNRMYRLISNKVKVEVEMEVDAQFLEDNLDSVNVVGEIPGTSKKDEIVMLGGHLDSWHGGTGATDNAAGCSVAMEAVRILMASGLKPQRTIRIALWSGEEEGLLGSRAYVKEHFGDRQTMALTAEHAKLDGYFNLDNGSGKVRGIYLQGNSAVAPIFEAWMAPFKDLGMTAITIRNTGGTDHLSFDALGLPGFQFIQDELEYETRTHHSNLDVADHVSGQDLMQASAIMASFVYHTAERPDLLPRKALPKPEKKSAEAPTPSAGN